MFANSRHRNRAPGALGDGGVLRVSSGSDEGDPRSADKRNSGVVGLAWGSLGKLRRSPSSPSALSMIFSRRRMRRALVIRSIFDVSFLVAESDYSSTGRHTST